METDRNMVGLVGLEQLKELKVLMDQAANLPSLRRLNSVLMQGQ
jgi:hypothetical protein